MLALENKLKINYSAWYSESSNANIPINIGVKSNNHKPNHQDLPNLLAIENWTRILPIKGTTSAVIPSNRLIIFLIMIMIDHCPILEASCIQATPTPELATATFHIIQKRRETTNQTIGTRIIAQNHHFLQAILK